MSKDKVTISVEEAEKHGCPYCNFRSHRFHVSMSGASMVSCAECERPFTVLFNGLRFSPFTDKQEVAPHPLKENLARGTKDEPPEEGEWFSSRGVGLDSIGSCVFCNQTVTGYQANISGFIKTKEAGERLLNWFENVDGLRAKGVFLDYRKDYPDRIQFKIGSCKDHDESLQILDKWLSFSDIITKHFIKFASMKVVPNVATALFLHLKKEIITSKKYYDEDNTCHYRRGRLALANELMCLLDTLTKS